MRKKTRGGIPWGDGMVLSSLHPHSTISWIGVLSLLAAAAILLNGIVALIPLMPTSWQYAGTRNALLIATLTFATHTMQHATSLSWRNGAWKMSLALVFGGSMTQYFLTHLLLYLQAGHLSCMCSVDLDL